MKKVIMNVITVIALAVPCGLVFTESWFLRFWGVVWGYIYIREIAIPLYKRYLALKGVRRE